MTTRSVRFFSMTSALALILIGAGVAVREPAWPNEPRAEAKAPAALIASLEPLDGVLSAPADDELSQRPAETPANEIEPVRRASNPNGALLQDLRRYQVREASLGEAASQGAADQTAALPPQNFVAPLPPSRPREFGGARLDFVAPLPPVRPAELARTPEAAPAPTITPASLPATDPASPSVSPEDGGLRMGSAAFVRIFKQEGQLELWLKRDGRYALYRTYPVCKWSGQLGPKLKQGDYQSPEGFYSVSARQLNPHSHYHLAFNVGFPNAFDRQNGRTGGAVMVHGDCKSVGCFAMTDKGIDEIYRFVAAAINAGQREVPVHIFPFRLTDAALAKETTGDWTTLWSAPSRHQTWSAFWRNLKDGYDLFEQTGEPPTAYACGDHYAFGPTGAACTKIAGW